MLEKLNSGLLRVLTPLGPRYLKPSFVQRVYLLWLFRNFPSLPAKVLNHRQLTLVDTMWAENRFVAAPNSYGMQDAPIIGTLEQRPEFGESRETERSESVSDTVSPYATD